MPARNENGHFCRISTLLSLHDVASVYVFSELNVWNLRACYFCSNSSVEVLTGLRRYWRWRIEARTADRCERAIPVFLSEPDGQKSHLQCTTLIISSTGYGYMHVRNDSLYFCHPVTFMETFSVRFSLFGCLVVLNFPFKPAVATRKITTINTWSLICDIQSVCRSIQRCRTGRATIHSRQRSLAFTLEQHGFWHYVVVRECLQNSQLLFEGESQRKDCQLRQQIMECDSS